MFSNEEIKSAFRDPIEDGNIEKTLIHVFNQGIEDNDVIIICGSFFIMADVREFLKFDDESDFKDVNKVVVEWLSEFISQSLFNFQLIKLNSLDKA